MTEQNDEIQKIKYQLRLVAESLDFNLNPIASLVVSMDWGEGELDRAHDIFEVYDKKLSNNEKVNWTAFEFELRDQFGIGYQRVKSIVLAFYKNHQWTNVCKEYATAHDCVEFHEITRADARERT